jgi:CheY-like chemotaxis protein
MRRDGSVLWLVAEDSEDDYFLLQRACSRLSSAPKLQRATNGVEARQYLAGEGRFHNRESYPLPSMVVSDLKMPLMDGLELLAWFKDQPWEPRIPFVLLTSSNNQSDRDRANERGADEFLTKPGSFGELVLTVAGIAERH